MDFIRTSYRTKARLWWDSPFEVDVRWFRAPPGAQQAPQPNYYVSGVWDDSRADHYPVIGDVYPLSSRYDKGANPLNYRGQNACGPLIAWQEGGRLSRDPVIVTDADGSSPCCANAGQIGKGGVGWGGGTNPIPASVATGGVLVGGHATVTVAPEVHATGGVLVGGSLTSTSPAAAHATGGVLVGGSGDFAESDRVYATGGVLVGGFLDASADGSADLLGGVLVGGSADLIVPVDLPSTGGVLVGGSADYLVGAVAHATGGVLVGGSLSSTSPAAAHATGGVLVGGNVTGLSPAGVSATGGVKIGGSQVYRGAELQTIFADEASTFSGTGPTVTHDANQNYGNFFQFTSPANGNYVEFKFFIQSGNYYLNLLGITSPGAGKLDVTIDGGTVATGIDFYAATNIYNTLKTVAISVLTDGLHTLRVTVNGKNASSSNYYIALTKLFFN